MHICIFSDSPTCPTGQGRVAREYGKRFKEEGHKVTYIAWDIKHKSIYDIKDPIFILTDISYGQLMEDPKRVIDHIAHTHPDVVLCIGDPFHFEGLGHIKHAIAEMNGGMSKFVGHLNIDSTKYAPAMNSIIYAFDKITVYSRFGNNVVKKICGIDAKVIPHGVDRSVFFPIENREPFDLTMAMPNPPAPTTEYLCVFLYVGRNGIRKGIGYALEAYARCLSTNRMDKSIFILLTDIHDPDGIPVDQVALELNITGHVLIMHYDLNKPIPDDILNHLYNIADFLVMPSMAEGFGLPVIEAMATGCIPIISDTGAFSDFPEDTLPIKTKMGGFIYSTSGGILECPDIDCLTDNMKIAYDIRHMISSKRPCIEGLNQVSKFDWDKSANSLLSDLFFGYNANYLPEANRSLIYREDIRSYICSQLYHLGNLRQTICVVKFGGIGDYVQLSPVLKGIRKRHIDRNIVLIANVEASIIDHPDLVDQIVYVQDISYDDIITAVNGIFNLVYDVRYVSRCYGLSETPYFVQNQGYYEGWLTSNTRISELGEHVVDIMIQSLGLENHIGINDMTVVTHPLPANVILPPAYIVFHNTAGRIGHLKTHTDDTEIIKLLQKLNGEGYKIVVCDPSGVIYEDVDIIDLRGKLTIHEIATLLMRAAGYLGVEGGLFHIAHAVGTSTAAWFTSTPATCFAYEDTIILNLDRPCKPCWWIHPNVNTTCIRGFPQCINLPTADEMYNALADKW